MVDALKITAWLRSPIAGDTTLNIDGILLYYAMVELHGAPIGLHPREAPVYDPSIVPLERLEWSGGWIYNASQAIWEGNPALSRGHIAGRYDTAIAEFSSDPNVDTGRGEFRNRFIQIEQSHAPSICWYVRGDGAKIKSYLKDVLSIGQYRSKGYGAILKWEFEETTHKPIMTPDGFPLRALPVGYIREHKIGVNINARVARIACRPPYWDVAGYEDCYMPKR